MHGEDDRQVPFPCRVLIFQGNKNKDMSENKDMFPFILSFKKIQRQILKPAEGK